MVSNDEKKWKFWEMAQLQLYISKKNLNVLLVKNYAQIYCQLENSAMNCIVNLFSLPKM
jgi:hypothetical protein